MPYLHPSHLEAYKYLQHFKEIVGIIGNELVGLGMLERSSSVNTQ